MAAVPRYQFPKNIANDPSIGHCMLIRAMSPGSATELTSAAIFIPGATSGPPVTFDTKHEYADIKMSKIIQDAAWSPIGVGFNAIQTAGAMFAGAVINPKVEVLYRNTDLRTFDFAFIMAPTSAEESAEMKNIIKMLRQYSSPTVASRGGWSDPREGYITNQYNYMSTAGIFNTPSEFLVHFLHRNGNGAMVENENLPKMGRCIIEGIEVMYNPNGEWSTFKDGSPLSAQLTVRFREMRVIDSRNIEQGY